jgi:serralysin
MRTIKLLIAVLIIPLIFMCATCGTGDQKSQLCYDPIYTHGVLPPVNTRTQIAFNPDGSISEVATSTQALSGRTESMWSPGEEITVGFYTAETTPQVIERIKSFAGQWSLYANVKFSFIDDVSQAKIKIGFDRNDGSWSWMGRDVLSNPFGAKTMNFGWLDNNTSDAVFRRVVLHEFGHALGFVHEHQVPDAGINWDREKVYEAFDGTWTKDQVDNYFFEKYAANQVNGSAYDRYSIMHYSIPAEFTLDGYSVPWNTSLSATDISFARYIYPPVPGRAASSGVLRTGDDCDEIEFVVEYGVVENGNVEFILGLGNDVTWWKAIDVPAQNGMVHLETQDRRGAATTTIQFDKLDRGKSIEFSKAKVLGVHTKLQFTWPALPALEAGCKVTLTWKKDRC